MIEIAIPIFDRLTALDAIGPYEVLSRVPRAQVRFLAHERGPKRTDNGMLALHADMALRDAPRPDVLVVPGGFGARAAARDEQLLEWLREAHRTTAWTTSVCTGSLILGAAGILNGLEATTHWQAFDLLARSGARPVRRRVVEDGKVITAAGVSAGIDMALGLAARLAGDELAQEIQLAIEYAPEPPFRAGSPETAPPAVVRAQARATRAATAARGEGDELLGRGTGEPPGVESAEP